MTRPWEEIGRAEGPDGVLTLRRRGPADFLLLIDGRVLMNSRAGASERALGTLSGQAVAGRPRPRVLVGGLGMGITLGALLDVLPEQAAVEVAELSPAIADWCAGPLAAVNAGALADPRVTLRIEDAAAAVARAGDGSGYDAIVFDLYAGPGDERRSDDPLFGDAALARTRAALGGQGVFAVWSERPGHGFERRLRRAGFHVERGRHGRGGLRHAVYLARAAPARGAGGRGPRA